MNPHDTSRSACPDEQTLSAYAENGLPYAQRRLVKGHLRACSLCREEVAFIQAALEDHTPDLARQNLLSWSKVVGAFGAAALLLALLLFRHLGNPQPIQLSHRLMPDGIALEWQAPSETDAFLIYRSSDEQPYVQLTTYPLTHSTTFLDRYAQDGLRYTYYVAAHTKSQTWHRSNEVTVNFQRVTTGAEDTNQNYAAAFEDYDGDGWLDLYVTNIRGPNHLYRNNQDGTFTDVTELAGIGDPHESNGALFGDYDDDGDLDLYVTNGHEPNTLYQNQGDGTFLDATEIAGVGGGNLSSFGAAWADFDKDGHLDLYVANFDAGRHGDYGPATNQLYLNQGNGTFAEAAHRLGVQGTAYHQGVLCSDLDDDGDVDIYVSVGFGGANLFYENLLIPEGQLAFRERGEEAGLTDVGRSSYGMASGDLDNDGDMDIYLANVQGEPNALYLNNGDGTFTDVAVLARVDDKVTDPTCISLADVNSDGYLDIIFQGRLYLNQTGRTGHLVFEQCAVFSETCLNPCVGDYDNDGDVDVYFSIGGSAPQNILYRNDEHDHNWLVVKLRQTSRNRYAVGSRLWLTNGPLTQTREVNASLSYLTQDSLALEFGLGSRQVVDRLRIRWPDGTEQELRQLPSNQILTLTKSGASRLLAQKQRTALDSYPQPITGFTPILFAGMSGL